MNSETRYTSSNGRAVSSVLLPVGLLFSMLLCSAMSPPQAGAIFDDPHAGIEGLRNQTGPAVGPPGAPPDLVIRGYCTAIAGVGTSSYQKPCLENADCGIHVPCTTLTADDAGAFDYQYPGAPAPIFRPNAEVNIDGEIYDPQSLAAFGLMAYNVTLDSSRDANNIGQGLGRYGMLERNDGIRPGNRRLACKGVFAPPVTACTGFQNASAALYPVPNAWDYRWDATCSDAVNLSFDFEETFTCTDPICCPAGLLDLDAPDCLAIGDDGISILGQHRVSVAVADAAMDRCWPLVEHFPFVVAVPELKPAYQGSERALAIFKDKSCPGGSNSRKCFSVAKFKTELEFGKDDAGADVGDLAELRGAATTEIGVHIRAGISRSVNDFAKPTVVVNEPEDPLIDPLLPLTIKNAGVAGREKWILKRGLSAEVKFLKIRWKDPTRPDIQMKIRSDGSGPYVHEDHPRPDINLTMTFGALPHAPTGRIVIGVGPTLLDSTDRGRWVRRRSGKRAVKNNVPACRENGGLLQINCPAPPNPNAPLAVTDPSLLGAKAQQPPQPAMATMAWNTFIAVNWPALDPNTHNNNRGIPDLSKSFATAQPGDLGVWETWKSKREVFFPAPYNDAVRNGAGCTVTSALGSRNFPNKIDAVDPQYQVPPICEWNRQPAYGSLAGETYGPGQDFEFCVGHSPDNRNFHSLDGTMQVLSQAVESQQAICLGGPDGGALDPVPDGTNGAGIDCTPGLVNDPCCEVTRLPDDGTGQPRSGRPVYARVAKDPAAPTYEGRQMIVYEVKMNYDSFAYIAEERYDLDGCAQRAAAASASNLPWRSDQDKPPSFLRGSPVLGAENGGVLQYSSEACLGSYEFANEVAKNAHVEPCRVGAIHIKSAWIPLTGGENPNDYHTATATHFRDDGGGGTCAAEELFGLVGLHVVQRTRQRDGAIGGTWLFSTFEHVGNDAAGFKYNNWWRNENHIPGTNPLAPTSPPLTPELAAATGAGEWFPKIGVGSIDVQRYFSKSAGAVAANADAHAALGCPGSVWCNYELTGIQWQPVDAAGDGSEASALSFGAAGNDPRGVGQQFWLANLAIESNTSTQIWQGQPPRQRVVHHFDDKKDSTASLPPRGENYPLRFMTGGFDSHDRFLRNNCGDASAGTSTTPDYSPTPDAFHDEYKNLAFRKRAFNMGGCIGCHAGAQVDGHSFSYTLAGGQRAVTPGTDADPGAEVAPPVAGLEDKTACDEPTVAACPLPYE